MNVAPGNTIHLYIVYYRLVAKLLHVKNDNNIMELIYDNLKY